jgi:predicted transcriptional regulator
LQICVEILCALAAEGPLKLSQVVHRVELNKTKLSLIICFLYDRCLVGEQNLDDDEKAYYVTERGVSVLKVIAPLIKEAQRLEERNFEAILSALSSVNTDVMKVKRAVGKSFSNVIDCSVVSQQRRSKKGVETYLRAISSYIMKI